MVVHYADDKKFAKAVVIGHHNRLALLDEQAINRVVPALIMLLAKQYGGRVLIQDFILKEAVEVVKIKFRHLSIDEIKEAYRQWATMETEVKGAEMYAGEFSATQISRVLGVYCKRRTKILSAYIKEKAKRDRAKRKVERDKLWKAEYDENFNQMLAEYKEKCDEWQDVPTYLYDSCMQRGLIQYEKGEQMSIFELAKKLAKRQLTEEINHCDDRLKIKSIKNRLNLLTPTAKVVARKITVYEKVFSKTINRNEE